MGNKRLKKRSLRKNRNKTIKKGAGMFDSVKSYSSRAYNSTKNSAKKLVSSGKDIANSKYLITLLANPSNVHRMIFKNAKFINFINFNQVQRLYCNGQQPNCVVLNEGYIYSSNPTVVASANNEEQNKQRDLQALNESGAISEAQQTATSPQEVAQVNQLIVNAEETSDKLDAEMDDDKIKKYGVIGKTLNRLAFAKLNDALLTDDINKANMDPNYITFKPGYQVLFEFFTIYKYQVNRTLWYGGWTEWAYITKSINQLIKNTPLLNKEFLSMLSEVGFLKLLKTIFETAPSYVLNKFKTISPNNVDQNAQEIDSEETQKALKKNKEEEMKDNTQQQQVPQQVPQQIAGQGFWNRASNGFNRTMSRGFQSMGVDINKYRVIRILLKYYDIDPAKYNLNLLKRTGILNKNYPVFMKREARKAVYTAIYNYKLKGNTRISQVTPLNPNDQKPYMTQTLDQLLDQLLEFNTYNGGKGTRKNGRNNKKIKMVGGGLFFENIKFIFSESYKFMINDEMNKLTMFMNLSPQINTELVAEMYDEIVKCMSMSTITLCMTLGNMLLGKFITGPVSVSTPHCYISNAMYMYIMFKLFELDYSKINVIKSIMSKNKNVEPTEEQPPLAEAQQVPLVQAQQVPLAQA